MGMGIVLVSTAYLGVMAGIFARGVQGVLRINREAGDLAD